MTRGPIKVKQTGSPIRRPARQGLTLKGLGLNKIGRVRSNFRPQRNAFRDLKQVVFYLSTS